MSHPPLSHVVTRYQYQDGQSPDSKTDTVRRCLGSFQSLCTFWQNCRNRAGKQVMTGGLEGEPVPSDLAPGDNREAQPVSPCFRSPLRIQGALDRTPPRLHVEASQGAN